MEHIPINQRKIMMKRTNLLIKGKNQININKMITWEADFKVDLMNLIEIGINPIQIILKMMKSKSLKIIDNRKIKKRNLRNENH